VKEMNGCNNNAPEFYLTGHNNNAAIISVRRHG